MLKVKNQAPQGDVLFTRVEVLPEGAEKRETRTVAYGEATGHHHTLTEPAEVWVLGGKQWVVVPDDAVVEHQEHAPFVLTPGVYKVDLQVQADPFTGIPRRVAD